MASTCLATVASAQPIDPQLKSAARKLGAEGIVLYRRGDFEGALDRFERAYKILPAPTLGVRAARCMVKLNRLVEASERYLEVTRYTFQPGDPFVYKQDIASAQRERDELQPRIPSLEIEVTGPRGDGIEVEVDGRAVPVELVGAAQPIDPGSHQVVVRRADTSVDGSVTVPEGETSRLTLELPALPPPREPQTPPDGAGVDWMLWTWVAFGVGAGGAVASIINGAIAVDQQNKLEARCPNRSCPPDAHGAANAYDATRYATTIGIVLGAVGGAAGGALLLFAPGDTSEGEGDTEVGIAGSMLTVRHRF
jgi:hypothetical protein